ncbi:MAG: hypothetical protein LBV12_10785 [Puniceicoccales bacterium]|jgi:hypothetical protein|nr:hypothetical protein [Puniceicoccales bacterium]
MNKKVSRKVKAKKRSRQICNAMKRAQIAAARKAMEFGQLLYIARNGKVVGIDPRKVLKMAGAM